ncbi:MAG: ABC transporter ATP-binding protein, partial [Clostridia bacterium]|nr:ABC transporter ATP-binding protein [Clostridia bacterium]
MPKRSLSSLQKQYARDIPDKPSGPRHRMQGEKVKPKNTKESVRRIFSYVMRYKGRLLLVLLCMAGQTVSALLASYMLAPIINRLQMFVFPDKPIEWTTIGRVVNGWIESLKEMLPASDPANAFAEISLYVLAAVFILAVVYLIGILAEYLQARLMMHISLNGVEALRNDLFSALQKLPVRYFDSNTTGEIMSRFTNDVDNIETMMNNTLLSLISGVISLIGTFLFMITTNVWLSLITVAFIPVFTVLAGFLGKRSGRYYAGQQAALGAVNGYIEETVTGAKVVKVFNHEQVCEEEFGMLNDDLRTKQFKAQFWGGIMWPVMGNVGQVT